MGGWTTKAVSTFFFLRLTAMSGIFNHHFLSHRFGSSNKCSIAIRWINGGGSPFRQLPRLRHQNHAFPKISIEEVFGQIKTWSDQKRDDDFDTRNLHHLVSWIMLSLWIHLCVFALTMTCNVHGGEAFQSHTRNHRRHEVESTGSIEMCLLYDM